MISVSKKLNKTIETKTATTVFIKALIITFMIVYLPNVLLYSPAFYGVIPSNIVISAIHYLRICLVLFIIVQVLLLSILLLRYVRNALTETDFKILISTVTFLLFLLPICSSTNLYHHHMLEKCVCRIDPLIKAIEKYSSENGFAPKNLDNLVPRYLSKVPSTGVSAAPDIYYSKDQARDRNPWMIFIVVHGFLTPGELVYLPQSNLSRNNSDEHYSIIGKWQYRLFN